MIGLLQIHQKKKYIPYAACAALLAATLLGITTITGVSGVISAILDPGAASGPAYKSTVYGAYTWASIAFLLGMLAFFVSLGISGWVRSPKLGIFSSTLSGAAITGVAYFLMFVVRGL